MKTILIVEDNIDIHNLIQEILQKENYRVINSYSGTEALMMLEKEKIDLILLDLMLPGLSGEEIIKKVKNIPIIVISAKISPEDKVNVLLNGANDYITKPFNKEELLARIKVQLRINADRKERKELKYKDMYLKDRIKSKKSYSTYWRTSNIFNQNRICHFKTIVIKSKTSSNEIKVTRIY